MLVPELAHVSSRRCRQWCHAASTNADASMEMDTTTNVTPKVRIARRSEANIQPLHGYEAVLVPLSAEFAQCAVELHIRCNLFNAGGKTTDSVCPRQFGCSCPVTGVLILQSVFVLLDAIRIGENAYPGVQAIG